MTTRLETSRPAGSPLVLTGAVLAVLLPALVFLGAMLKTGALEVDIHALFSGAMVGLMLMGVGYLKQITHTHAD